MRDYIKLLRPKDWAKNSFLFIPSFFAGKLFNPSEFQAQFVSLIGGFIAFSFLASSIYIINDYRDIEDDRKHPKKCKRPMASGKIKKGTGLAICILLAIVGLGLSYWLDPTYKFLFIMGIYYSLNLGYCFGLKNISILDILIVSTGFVLRVKGGAVLAHVHTTEWLIIMTFLLALFMAIAKRRDDVMLKVSTGTDMRKAIKGYSLEFLNTLLGLILRYPDCCLHQLHRIGRPLQRVRLAPLLYSLVRDSRHHALSADHICTEPGRLTHRDPLQRPFHSAYTHSMDGQFLFYPVL
jgi:decaprenyl-phosphate phosphoribosyltransferase